MRYLSAASFTLLASVSLFPFPKKSMATEEWGTDFWGDTFTASRNGGTNTGWLMMGEAVNPFNAQIVYQSVYVRPYEADYPDDDLDAPPGYWPDVWHVILPTPYHVESDPSPLVASGCVQGTAYVAVEVGGIFLYPSSPLEPGDIDAQAYPWHEGPINCSA